MYSDYVIHPMYLLKCLFFSSSSQQKAEEKVVTEIQGLGSSSAASWGAERGCDSRSHTPNLFTINGTKGRMYIEQCEDHIVQGLKLKMFQMASLMTGSFMPAFACIERNFLHLGTESEINPLFVESAVTLHRLLLFSAFSYYPKGLELCDGFKCSKK